MRRMLGACALAAAVALAVACGGSESDRSADAGRAAAQFWQQEASAGRLPEGTTVRERGTKAIVALDKGGGDGVEGRYCVEFEYMLAESPFSTHVRVYIATLTDDVWSVEAVEDAETCEGVV